MLTVVLLIGAGVVVGGILEKVLEKVIGKVKDLFKADTAKPV